jgi:hypothetical protein
MASISMHSFGYKWVAIPWLLIPGWLLVACQGPTAGPTLACETCRIVCGQCEEPDRFVRLSAEQRHQEPDRGNPSIPGSAVRGMEDPAGRHSRAEAGNLSLAVVAAVIGSARLHPG